MYCFRCAGTVGTLGNSDHDGDTVQVIISKEFNMLYRMTRKVRRDVPRGVLETEVEGLIPKTATKFQTENVYQPSVELSPLCIE